MISAIRICVTLETMNTFNHQTNILTSELDVYTPHKLIQTQYSKFQFNFWKHNLKLN